MTRSNIFTFLSMACITIALAPAAKANLIVNGDFEDQPSFGINGDGSYTYLTGSQMPGWTIEVDHAVTVHNSGTYPHISGTYSMNTDGEGFGGHNANVYQDFSSTAGEIYDISYDWLGWQQSTTTLDIRVEDTVTGNTVFDDQHDWDNLGVHNFSSSFTGTGNLLRLRIFHNPESGVNDNTFVVDNFSVTSVVPEPISMVTLSLGLLGFTQRRKAKN